MRDRVRQDDPELDCSIQQFPAQAYAQVRGRCTSLATILPLAIDIIEQHW